LGAGTFLDFLVTIQEVDEMHLSIEM
jgi:hypothetical protein